MNHVQPQLDLFYLYIPALYLPPSPQFPSELPSIDSFFLSALPSSPPPLSLPFNQGSGQPTPFPTDPKKRGKTNTKKKKKKEKKKYFFSTQNPNQALHLPHPRLGKHSLAKPPTTLAGADAHGELFLRGEAEGLGEAGREILGGGCVET